MLLKVVRRSFNVILSYRAMIFYLKSKAYRNIENYDGIYEIIDDVYYVVPVFSTFIGSYWNYFKEADN